MEKYEVTKASYNNLAVQYQDKFMDMDLYHYTYDLFCKRLNKPDASIFEIACGPGNITRYLLNYSPDYKIWGTDVAEKMVELAVKNNPTARFEVMDCRDINKVDEKFDAVVCGFGLPYLTKEDAIQLIADVSSLLEKGGLFYLSTMEDDYNKSKYQGPSFGGPDRVFIHYHEAKYLTEALENNGFNIINLHRQNYPEKDGSITVDLILIARKVN